MNKKFTLVSVLLISVCIIISGIFSCNLETHIHTFSDEWSYNSTHHWHNATCEHTDKVSEKSAHIGEITIITEATDFIPGKQKIVCTVCNNEVEQVIPAKYPTINSEPYSTRRENLDFIFNNQTLGTTTITIRRSEWNKLCDNYRYFYKNENSVHAELYEYEKDEEKWSIPNVGFRQRGNTSRLCPQGIDNGREQGQMNEQWLSEYYNYAEQPNDDYRQVHFKVDFEEFLEGDDEFKMAGCMKGVSLKRLDHSLGREIFCYDLFHRYGIWTAPRASHTRLILKFIEDEDVASESNDIKVTEINYGVYEMFEDVNKQSLKARSKDEGEDADNLWANNKGNLWKCQSALTNTYGIGVENIVIIFDEKDEPIDRIWKGYSLDLKTNKDEEGFAKAETELKGFITELNNLPNYESSQNITTIKAFYEKWFDMDFFLKTYAVSITLGMDDDYWGNANNYYLYFDTGKKGTGKVYYIPFDYDNTLGGSIFEGGFKQNPLEWGRGNSRPLMDRMLLVPEYKQKFIDYLLQVTAEDSEWNYERCSKQFTDWIDMLNPYVNSPDLVYRYGNTTIGADGFWDGTWQPEGYSLTNYNNNIWDATRESFKESLIN